MRLRHPGLARRGGPRHDHGQRRGLLYDVTGRRAGPT
jgi:hypothetical protein